MNRPVFGKMQIFGQRRLITQSLPAGLLLLGLGATGQAAEQERVLESPRFLGRGNTFVAAPDSDESLRGNPATLGEDSKVKFQIRWLQFDLMIGQNSIDTVSDLTSVDGTETAVTLLQKFEDKFGKRQYARIQLSPVSMRILQFEISPFVSNASWIDMRLPTTPEVSIKSDTMMGLNIGFGAALTKEIWAGVVVRPAQRILLDGTLGFADVVDFLPPTSRELEDVIPLLQGSSLGVDLGLTWRPAKAWRFGLLVENVGDTSTMGDSLKAPPPIQQRISLGTQYRVDFAKAWHWDWYVDLQDLANRQGYNGTRLLHLGTEFGRSLFTRDHDIGLLAGLNEGWPTFGGFVDFWIARFDIVNYGVELGEVPGDRPDRRWGSTLRVATTF
jgi:hypothetical protein